MFKQGQFYQISYNGKIRGIMVETVNARKGYIVAFDLVKGAYRTFTIDKITLV